MNLRTDIKMYLAGLLNSWYIRSGLDDDTRWDNIIAFLETNVWNRGAAIAIYAHRDYFNTKMTYDAVKDFIGDAFRAGFDLEAIREVLMPLGDHGHKVMVGKAIAAYKLTGYPHAMENERQRVQEAKSLGVLTYSEREIEFDAQQKEAN